MDKKSKKKLLNKTFGASNKVLNESKKLMLGSLAMVSALAWNSAFQTFFENNKYLKKGGPWIYAISVTSICVIILYFMKQA